MREDPQFHTQLLCPLPNSQRPPHAAPSPVPQFTPLVKAVAGSAALPTSSPSTPSHTPPNSWSPFSREAGPHSWQFAARRNVLKEACRGGGGHFGRVGPACASALASDPLAPPELSIWAPLNPKRCLLPSSLPASSTALVTTCLPQFLVFLPGTELGWAGPWEPQGLVRWGWDRENPKIRFAPCRPLLLFPGAQISGPRRAGHLHPLWGQDSEPGPETES